MFLLWSKMFFSFPALFFTGINTHRQDTKSVNFKEATEAYSKPKG